MYEVQIGQVWRREVKGEYSFLEVTSVRNKGLTAEYELTPIDFGDFQKKGRKSWKWRGGIVSELTFIAHTKDY